MGKISEAEKKKNYRRKKKSVSRTKAEIRAKRRRARRRIVLFERTFIAALVLAVLGGGFFLVWNLPSIKLNRQLDEGKEYEKAAAYSEAIESYEKALQLDSTSVQAYRCMASAYLDMEDKPNAKKILFEGWENTQDESLFKYYCTVILNEAVEEINAGQCTLDTVDKILSVLEQDADNADATELMHKAYEHLISSLTEETAADFFYDMDGEAEYCNFTAYENIMNRLFACYRAGASEELKRMIAEYGAPVSGRLRVSRQHLDSWRQILESADEITGASDPDGLLVCLEKETEIQNIFADMFTEFDAGNYEAAKDFIISDTYTGIRDAFINGTMEYWKGETSIPVSRETVILEQTEEGWGFSYPTFKENESTAGIITVWGNQMTDSGVQRSCISYEPAEQDSGYYPHTEYVISYMNSNVQKKNSFKEEMNYHFETRTWTEEGMITHMIGDWGGPWQWEKTY